MKNNIFANLLGSLWNVLMNILLIPLYIKFLGIESWALIGFFTTLQALVGLLDIGLGSTFNRELTLQTHRKGDMKSINTLLHSLEYIYLFISLLTILSFYIIAPFLANGWFVSNDLSSYKIIHSVYLMGIALAIQMPIGLYSGGILGLQQHIILNKINISVSTIRGIGSLFVLWGVSNTIEAYLIWQIVSFSINFFLVRNFLKGKLSSTDSTSRFDLNSLKRVWKFSLGVTGISIMGIILTQIDKVILSKLVTMTYFGYYMLASTVASSISRVISPYFNSIFPKFTEMVAKKNESELIIIYHKACQLLSVLLFPISVTIALFSFDIIFIWTQNEEVAQNTSRIVSILVFGTAINGLLTPPYALQLANNWTSLSLKKNIFNIIVFVPLFFFLSYKYSSIGAALSWLFLNIGGFFIEIIFMHKKLLKSEMLKWYFQDVLLPFSICLLLLFLGKTIGNIYLPEPNFKLPLILLLFTITFFAVLLLTPTTRAFLLNISKKYTVKRFN